MGEKYMTIRANVPTCAYIAGGLSGMFAFIVSRTILKSSFRLLL